MRNGCCKLKQTGTAQAAPGNPLKGHYASTFLSIYLLNDPEINR